MSPGGLDLRAAVRLLLRGDLGIFPAKNGYMIVGLVSEEHAREIRAIKRKTVVNPLVRVLLHERDDAMAGAYVTSLPAGLRGVFERFKGADTVFATTDLGFTYAKGTHEMALLKALVRPIYASSANRSGETTPFRVQDIPQDIKRQVSFVYDVGSLSPREDFTVVDIGRARFYRRGVDADAIERALKAVGKTVEIRSGM